MCFAQETQISVPVCRILSGVRGSAPLPLLGPQQLASHPSRAPQAPLSLSEKVADLALRPGPSGRRREPPLPVQGPLQSHVKREVSGERLEDLKSKQNNLTSCMADTRLLLLNAVFVAAILGEGKGAAAPHSGGLPCEPGPSAPCTAPLGVALGLGWWRETHHGVSTSSPGSGSQRHPEA